MFRVWFMGIPNEHGYFYNQKGKSEVKKVTLFPKISFHTHRRSPEEQSKQEPWHLILLCAAQWPWADTLQSMSCSCRCQGSLVPRMKNEWQLENAPGVVPAKFLQWAARSETCPGYFLPHHSCRTPQERSSLKLQTQNHEAQRYYQVRTLYSLKAGTLQMTVTIKQVM